jgi:uncharacterized membrane protein
LGNRIKSRRLKANTNRSAVQGQFELAHIAVATRIVHVDAPTRLYIHLMQMTGWLMIALFVWLFHGPWLAFKRAVDVEDWPSASATLNRIRHIAVNLPLGLLIVVIGGSGRYWG